MIEIGSDFEVVNSRYLNVSGKGIPSEADWFLSGRMALRVMASEWARRGIHTAAVPNHHCYSMTAPFIEAGLAILPLPVNSTLVIASDALSELRSRPEGIGLLYSETFGQTGDVDIRSQLDQLREVGCLVAVDETHSVLLGDHYPSDYRIASLRKLLPVTDGAYLYGAAPDTVARATENPTISRQLSNTYAAHRISAAVSKSAYHSGRKSRKTHLGVFNDAEKWLDSHNGVLPMSEHAEATLPRLRFGSLLKQRRENATSLIECLTAETRLGVVNESAAISAGCFVVLRHVHAQAIRSMLAERGIYCPFHWPAPPSANPSIPWRSDIFSVPIDHRYSAADMRYVGYQIQEVIDSL